MRVPKFIHVLFHNLENYDAHLFVKSFGYTEGDINCIPKTDEKYISFSKVIPIETYIDTNGEEKTNSIELRFLDSQKITQSSLDALASNLGKNQFVTLENEMGKKNIELSKRTGVFPYEVMDGFDKLQYGKLPEKKEFHSKLSSDEDYAHAQNVWKMFGCKTMRDYHNVYLKTDVLLLTDIMENFRNLCMENYGLDPMWYYTAPGLAWDAALKITNVNLELLTDPIMYLMVENGIRGGISTITKKIRESYNNKYMENYDEKKESVYIPYLYANNLYGWAMSQPLPTHVFEWMTEDELPNWQQIPCILEVDLSYPKELHDPHNEYPLAPKKSF